MYTINSFANQPAQGQFGGQWPSPTHLEKSIHDEMRNYVGSVNYHYKKKYKKKLTHICKRLTREGFRRLISAEAFDAENVTEMKCMYKPKGTLCSFTLTIIITSAKIRLN